MRAGELRHRVTFFQKVDVRDSGEGVTRTDHDVCSAWAEIVELEGRELERAMQTDPRATHRVRVRYRSLIAPRQFVRWGARVLEMVAPPLNVDGRDIELRILCKESR